MKLLGAAIVIIATAGCYPEPEAKAWCEQKASCYLVDDEETCMSDLGMEAEQAGMCQDEFLAYLDCQVNEVSFTCGDNVDRLVAETCGRLRCEYYACPNQNETNPCDDATVVPSGRWKLTLTPSGYPACSALVAVVDLDVRASGESYTVTTRDTSLMVTATVDVSSFGATVTVQLAPKASGSASPSFSLELFAQPRFAYVAGTELLVSGIGEGTVAGCSGTVAVAAQWEPLPR